MRCPVTGYACSTAYNREKCKCDTCRAWMRQRDKKKMANPEYAARRRASKRRYNYANREKQAAWKRAKRLEDPLYEMETTWRRQGFDLTREQYEKMLAAQGGVCAGCGGVCSTNRILSVDHCHDTGRVRGLLCNDCNVSLGRLGENPAVLRRLADYLDNEGHPSKEHAQV